MAASYPSAVKTFTTISDGDTAFAIQVNALYDEVTAIETALLNGWQHNLSPLTDNAVHLGDATHAWKNLYTKGTVGLNGIVYTFPAADGAASTFLQTNGSKVLSWATPSLAGVAGGGTGVATLTSNGVIIGNGTSPVTVTAEGATGQVLTGVTGADPTFQTPTHRFLDGSTTAQDVTNTTTETSVYAFTVPGGTLGTTKILRLTLTGLTHVDTTSATVTVRVKWGGVTIATAALALTATQNGGYQLVAIINANGATNAQRAVVVLTCFNLGSNETVAVLQPTQSTVGNAYHDALTADSTADQVLTVTAQWASALTTNHFRRWTAMTEILG